MCTRPKLNQLLNLFASYVCSVQNENATNKSASIQ